MKILHTISVPKFNALAWYGLNMAYAQSLAGHTVHIIAHPSSPVLENAKALGLTNCFPLPINTPNIFRQIISLFKLKKYIDCNNIEVVNGHNHKGLWLLTKAAQWAKNKPVIIGTRGDVCKPEHSLFDSLLSAKWFDGLVVASKCIETTIIDKKQIQYIPPCIDTEYFKRAEHLAETKHSSAVNEIFPIFGLIGRIDRKKGHFIVLRALKVLINKGYNVRCVVAGPEADTSYEELKNFAREERLTQRIFFLGKVSDIRDVYRICDCGIIASTASETICRVALEFMAMNIPVIASRLNGISDVVPEQHGCLLFDTGSHTDLADKMEKFLNKHGEWHKWKREIRNYAVNKFCLSRLADESVAFYKRIRSSFEAP